MEKVSISYEVSNNRSELIDKINAYTKEPKKAAYCGSTIGYFCSKAGVNVQGMPISMMSVAKNWSKQGKLVYHIKRGWITKKQTPDCDEIFVMLLKYQGYHIEIPLLFLGGTNTINGAGNTSNWQVRRPPFEHLDLNGKRADVYVKHLRKEGIFAHKERNKDTGLVGIYSFKVQIYDTQR